MEPSGREGASERPKLAGSPRLFRLPVLRKGVGEPRARHRAMVEWAPWLLTHKRITQRALLPGAVLTTVGLVVLMLLASYVMEFSVSLYARDYGGFGVVLAISFWILLSSAGRRAFRRPLRSGAFSDEAGQRRDSPARHNPGSVARSACCADRPVS